MTIRTDHVLTTTWGTVPETRKLLKAELEQCAHIRGIRRTFPMPMGSNQILPCQLQQQWMLP